MSQTVSDSESFDQAEEERRAAAGEEQRAVVANATLWALIFRYLQISSAFNVRYFMEHNFQNC